MHQRIVEISLFKRRYEGDYQKNFLFIILLLEKMKKISILLLMMFLLVVYIPFTVLSEDGNDVNIILSQNNSNILNLNIYTKANTFGLFLLVKLPDGCHIDVTKSNWEMVEDGIYLVDPDTETMYIQEASIFTTEQINAEGPVTIDIAIPLSGNCIGDASVIMDDSSYIIGDNHSESSPSITNNSVMNLTLGTGESDSPAIPTSSITDTTTGAATVTGTVSDGKATLNVACDKACVVAYTKDNGATYTPVSAVQADSGYNFVVPDYSENMKFVVALKGDVTGDGILDSTDTGQVKAVQLGKIKTFTALQTLAADLDGNGTIESTDAGQIKAAQLGKIQLAW